LDGDGSDELDESAAAAVGVAVTVAAAAELIGLIEMGAAELGRSRGAAGEAAPASRGASLGGGGGAAAPGGADVAMSDVAAEAAAASAPSAAADSTVGVASSSSSAGGSSASRSSKKAARSASALASSCARGPLGTFCIALASSTGGGGVQGARKPLSSQYASCVSPSPRNDQVEAA